VTEDREPLSLWWCQTKNGDIVEHETRTLEGHEGHVRCIDVGYVVRRPQ
jgi:hypothetical protein